MVLKRLAAIVLALPLLHLNVAPEAIACESHGNAASAAVADVHAGHHSAGHGDIPAPRHELPDEDAGTTECCQALATCSLSFGAVTAQLLTAPMLPKSEVASITRRMPLSRISTPEPPPPKA